MASPAVDPVTSPATELVSHRVGLVCPYSLSTPGGVQNHVIGLAGHLNRSGHDVSVLAPGRPDPDTLERLGLSPAQFVSAGGAVPVPYNGSVARVSFGPVQAARVRRWLRAEQFDLVHVHEPVTPSVAWHTLVATQTPVVATFHTANPSSRSMRIAGRVMTEVIDKIDVRIAVSPTAARMVADHLDRDSQVIPNGFDHAEFADPGTAMVEPPRTSYRRPRLVFLGRLTEPRKGLDVLLDALPAILAQHPDLEVLVAGQGRRRLPAPCRALGQVADVDRARLLATADVFVAPHVARESFGLVLIEALAAGAPVVASDLAAFVDVLTGEPDTDTVAASSCGRLFPAADPRSLAEEVLATLATIPADLAAQRRRGRDLTRRFDWTQVGPLVEQAYAQALAGPRTMQVDTATATMSVRWPHAA